MHHHEAALCVDHALTPTYPNTHTSDSFYET